MVWNVLANAWWYSPILFTLGEQTHNFNEIGLGMQLFYVVGLTVLSKCRIILSTPDQFLLKMTCLDFHRCKKGHPLYITEIHNHRISPDWWSSLAIYNTRTIMSTSDGAKIGQKWEYTLATQRSYPTDPSIFHRFEVICKTLNYSHVQRCFMQDLRQIISKVHRGRAGTIIQTYSCRLQFGILLSKGVGPILSFTFS